MTSSPEKLHLRTKMIRKRNALSVEQHTAFSRACCERLVTFITTLKQQRSIVAGYAPIRSEIDVNAALSALASEGVATALPCTVEGERLLRFRHYTPGDALVEGLYNIREPSAQAELVVPTILIIPLLAFDRRGHRLGYGSGYYDVTLARLRADNADLIAIGAAFSLQEETRLPNAAHDGMLTHIVTEKESISIA